MAHIFPHNLASGVGGFVNEVLLAFSLLCVSTTSYQDADRARFVSEGANSSFKDGVLDLRGGEGWLRFPRLLTDFRLAFDFRPTTLDTDAGVIVRSWPDWVGLPDKGYRGWPDKGYRFVLPASARSETSSVFVGRGEKVVIVQEGRITLRPPHEWQHVEITAEGRRLTFLLNGIVTGVYEVEGFAGYILFDNRKGRVHLRNIGITTIERNAEWREDAMTVTQLKSAGGQPPKLVREVKPIYTPKTVGQQVQGTVRLEVVVLPDGSTVPVRITRSLEPDLDLSAAVAAKGWKFKPGILNGQPVPVLAVVEMSFTLK